MWTVDVQNGDAVSRQTLHQLSFFASCGFEATIILVVIVPDCRHHSNLRPQNTNGLSNQSGKTCVKLLNAKLRRCPRCQSVSATSHRRDPPPTQHFPLEDKTASESARVVVFPQLPVTAMKVTRRSATRLNAAWQFNSRPRQASRPFRIDRRSGLTTARIIVGAAGLRRELNPRTLADLIAL